ncbi:MAG: hypothetical protein ABIF40_02740 [archaeon]
MKKMKILKKENLDLPNYVNTKPVGKVGETDILLHEVGAAAIFAGLQQLYMGPKSTGKTQLMRDFSNAYFAGNKHSLLEEGRSDFKPKELFEKLNISLAHGRSESMPEITAVYDSGEVKYLVRSINDNNELTWKPISREDKEQIEVDYSLTTDNLVQLKNIGKKFFGIDEYRRCPEVVMNMFYGLMVGELNFQGEILKLGDGYYSGIAAVNPDDYAGNFDMDLAMRARFPVALDFGAYTISVKDKDELNKRNNSPGVQDAPKVDLTEAIEEIFNKINNDKVTLKERVILQYFQTALDVCTKQDIEGKDKFFWPRYCSKEGCDKQTKNCGTLQGIDGRAIKGVYRLAKGLEEIVKLKEGEDVEIDPVDSFVLAYKFVAPYKGVVSPVASKTKMGFEALVLEDVVDSIRTTLSEKFEKIYEVARLEAGNLKVSSNLQWLKREFQRLNRQDAFSGIEEQVRKDFEETKKVSDEEFLSQFSDEILEKQLELYNEMIETNLDSYTDLILGGIKQVSSQDYEKLLKLKKANEYSLRQYAKVSKDSKKSFNDFKASLSSQINTILLQYGQAFVADEEFRSELPDVKQEAISTLRQFEKDEFVFVPLDRKSAMSLELKKRLAEKLKEIRNEDFGNDKENLFAGEWSFLKRFYSEFVEEVKNETNN